MTKSGLCDYSDAYILVKGTITINGDGLEVGVRKSNERNKGVIFKICAPFIEWISQINNIQTNNAK